MQLVLERERGLGFISRFYLYNLNEFGDEFVNSEIPFLYTKVCKLRHEIRNLFEPLITQKKKKKRNINIVTLYANVRSLDQNYYLTLYDLYCLPIHKKIII